MSATIKCVGGADGFTKGESYPVLCFGDTTVVVQNDDGAVVPLSYAKTNNSDLWEVHPDGEKKAGKKSAKD